MKASWFFGASLLMLAVNGSAETECRCESFPFLPSPPCPKVCSTLLVERADIDTLAEQLDLSNEEIETVQQYRLKMQDSKTQQAGVVEVLSSEQKADIERVRQKIAGLDREQFLPIIKTVDPAEREVSYSNWKERSKEIQVPIRGDDMLKQFKMQEGFENRMQQNNMQKNRMPE